MKDYYEILGVAKSASQEEIKRAYRKLAHQHHPDKGGDASKFKVINEAYQVLSDVDKRSQYDRFGQAGGNFGPTGDGGAGNSGNFGDFENGFGFSFGGGGLGDLFGDLFANAFATVQAEVKITPAQAILGDEIKVKLQNEDIAFAMPAGTQDGTQFRFKGKGAQTRKGGRGDLILVVKIEMPKHPSREEKELYRKLRDLETKKHSWFKF